MISNKAEILVISFVIFLVLISGSILEFTSINKNYSLNNNENNDMGLKCTIYDQESFTKTDKLIKSNFSTDEYKTILQGY